MARPAVTQSLGNASEPSIGDLVSQAIKDVTTLVKCEIDLAKVELRGDARRVGLAVALGGTIMFFGFLILVMVSFAYAYGLITAGIWTWAAFLIVAGYVGCAGDHLRPGDMAQVARGERAAPDARVRPGGPGHAEAGRGDAGQPAVEAG